MSSSKFLARELPPLLTGVLVAGTFVALCWLERRRPLRRETQNKFRRNLRNVAIAVGSAVTIRFVEKPLVARLAGLVHENRWGVVGWMRLPIWLEVPVAAVLLDYTLWIWHVLTHQAPFLWRFHEVHHADLDLDASTAIRFHFGEMLLSVPWCAAQVLLVGAAPLSLSVWQTTTLVAILFHHANVRLPIALERRLCRLIVTPRMHGIHHSIVPEETNSNWGTVFSWPDYLHGTVLLAVPQSSITIGVPDLRR